MDLAFAQQKKELWQKTELAEDRLRADLRNLARRWAEGPHDKATVAELEGLRAKAYAAYCSDIAALADEVFEIYTSLVERLGGEGQAKLNE